MILTDIRRVRNAAVVLVLFAIVLVVPAQVTAQDKRPLEIEDYAQWKSISQKKLSDDGTLLVYRVMPQYGNGELVVKVLDCDSEHRIPQGKNPVITKDGSRVLFLVGPPLDDKNKEDKKVKSKLGILTVADGEVQESERVSAFKVTDNGRWLAYKKFKPEEEKSEGEEKKADKKEKKKETGTEIVLLDLTNGNEKNLYEADDFTFDKNSRFLVYSCLSEDEDTNGIYAVDLSSLEIVNLLSGKGKYDHLTWDENNENLAFVSDKEDPGKDDPEWDIYRWALGESSARQAVQAGSSRGFPKDMLIAKNPRLEWSDNAGSIFFNISDKPAEKDTTVKEEDLPGIDIWHWKDVLIQTQQKIRLNSLKNKSYKAVYHVDMNRTVRLADDMVKTVQISPNYAFVAGGDLREYEYAQPWNPTWLDLYLIDALDGSKTLVSKKLRGRVRWSDAGKYLYWFTDEDWYAYSIENGNTYNLTERIPAELRNILNDRPSVKGPWGNAGWTTDDGGMLVYDQFDIWYAPVDGEPVNITGGEGKRRNVTFRYIQLDPEEKSVDLDQPMLLRMLNNRTKAQGFYRLMNGTRNPVKLIDEPKKLGNPQKAKDADVLLFTRESYTEFPDLHISDDDFKGIKKVTDANPQQAQFKWGTEQLIEWKSTDGEPLKGVLYLPEDFEEGKQYPLILYIYEIMSGRMHSYSPPIANHRFNATEYNSHGYAVLYPDIVYDKGLPGPSSVKCLVPAVQKVIDMGIADPKRIGVQGHSWGGYETAYLATATDIFAAICSGAPVSNMTSAYGGIRWGSGNPRTFQYETGQSRIGGPLWEFPELYIENSPLFFADRVNTPFLMHHGDEDGAVPWYQAIEFFLALRRLDKPVWFLQYNGEPHHLQEKKNKYDWTVRMFQFFEHYLKDAPMPEWMEKGVPRVDKGRK